MARKCRTNKRNYCAPDGKIAVLFIDIDGTILECEPYFQAARERFGFLMARLGFNREEAIETLTNVDRENAHLLGFERDRFADSMVQAYEKLVEVFNEKARSRRSHKKVLPEVIGICQDIGNSPFFRDPKLFAHAAAVLGRQHHNFRLIAVTIGDREAQKYKIRQAGLEPIFDDILITPHDNKAERVQEAIDALGIDPHLSAFIGNSRKSDGICLTKTNFIYLPLEGGWAFDKDADIPENSGFTMWPARSWLEAEERGIRQLLWRRETADGSDSCSPDEN